jgi:hypothetical protein
VVRFRWPKRIRPLADAADELFAAEIGRDRFDPKIWAIATASAQDPELRRGAFLLRHRHYLQVPFFLQAPEQQLLPSKHGSPRCPHK